MPAFFCATCKQRHVDKNPNCCRKEICRQVNHAEINPYLNFQKSPSPESSLRSLRNSCGRLDCSRSTFYQLFGPNFYSSRVPAVSSYFEGSRSVRTSGIQQRTQFHYMHYRCNRLATRKRTQQLPTLLGQQCWEFLPLCQQWCANGCNNSQQYVTLNRECKRTKHVTSNNVWNCWPTKGCVRLCGECGHRTFI